MIYNSYFANRTSFCLIGFGPRGTKKNNRHIFDFDIQSNSQIFRRRLDVPYSFGGFSMAFSFLGHMLVTYSESPLLEESCQLSIQRIDRSDKAIFLSIEIEDAEVILITPYEL